MKSTAVKAWLTLLLLALAGYFGYSAWRLSQARREVSPPLAYQPPEVGFQIEPFTMTDQQGEPYDVAQLKGKVWVASFFFTECAGACINLNNTIAALQQEMPNVDVHYVSISVDPKKDSPEELAKYAAHYKADPARWTFLTGTPEQVEHVAQDLFKVSSGRLTHSDRMVVVGPDMKTVGYYRSGEPTDVVILKKKLASLTASSPAKVTATPSATDRPL